MLAAISCLSATPLPQTAVGTDKNVLVSNEDLQVLAGGGLGGTLDGFSTYFWCVDYEHLTALDNPYTANVVALGNWTAEEKNQVQKGNNTNWGLASPDLSVLQRYQVAAYLLSQMSTYQTLTPQTGSVRTADENLQLSLWKVLNQGTPTAVSPSPYNMAPLDAAVSYVQSNPTYGFGAWAVVSGISSGGELTQTARQTFLVALAPVPEPAAYALIGLGLGAVAFIGRKKA